MRPKIDDPRPGDLLTARFVSAVASAYRWVQGLRVDPTSGLVARRGPGGIGIARSGWPDLDVKITGASAGVAGAYIWTHVVPSPGGGWDDDATLFGDDTNQDYAYEYSLNTSIAVPFYTRLSRIGNEWRFPGYACS